MVESVERREIGAGTWKSFSDTRPTTSSSAWLIPSSGLRAHPPECVRGLFQRDDRASHIACKPNQT